MIKEENEEIAICPICSETLTINLYFACDGYFYDQNCISELNYKSPKSIEDFSYYLLVKLKIGVK